MLDGFGFALVEELEYDARKARFEVIRGHAALNDLPEMGSPIKVLVHIRLSKPIKERDEFLDTSCLGDRLRAIFLIKDWELTIVHSMQPAALAGCAGGKESQDTSSRFATPGGKRQFSSPKLDTKLLTW